MNKLFHILHPNKTQEFILAFIVIGLSVVYQIHCAIHGFDLTDEGYLMSLYQWFGRDINFAKGAGGYPLTCWFGSQLNALTPGILPMRLWGIGVVALTEIVVFLYLRRHFNSILVLTGLFIQAVMVAGDPKPFGYNTLTAFVSIMALISIMEGSKKQWYSLLFIGGVLLGVNVFIRIPNLTCWVFILCPFLVYYTKRRQIPWHQGIKQSACIFLGAITGTIITWFWMRHVGADGMIVELFSSMTGTLQGKSTHSLGSLLSTYVGNLVLSIIIFIVFSACIIVSSFASSSIRVIWKLCLLAISFLSLYQITYIQSNLLGRNIFAILNGIALFGTFPFLLSNTHQRNTAVTAFMFSLLIPLGSDGGYQTMWVGTWLALPVGLCGIYKFIQFISQTWTHVSVTLHSSNVSGNTRRLRIPKLSYGYLFCIFTLVIVVLIKIEHKPYYAPGNRSSKNVAIASSLADGIYASGQRAKIINPLLIALQEYIQPGDTMLVYDSSPLLYYLTETKPFAGISWPCVYYGQAYVDEFVRAEQATTNMPVLILQHFYTSNYWSKISPLYLNPEEDNNFSSTEMTQIIIKFIKHHNYQTKWSNGYYDIMLPQTRDSKKQKKD